MRIKPAHWTHHSRSERSISVNGRHFFAVRCGRRFFWRVDEIDQADPNGAKDVQLLKLSACTKDLSAIVMKAVGL